MSDERRRKRYDATGNTSESLDIEDDDFNWLDFFRAQWNETVTSTTILDFKRNYQGSDEEKRDVITAYKKGEGSMTRIFREVQLSNMLDDEERFRKWIDEEIEAGRMIAYGNYRSETEQSKQKRRNRAEQEARDAEAHFQDLERKGKLKGTGGDLAAIIQQRQQSRAENFLNDIEAKYAVPNGKSKQAKGKRKRDEEPPNEPSEEAFQEMGKRAGRSSKQKKESLEPKKEDDINNFVVRSDVSHSDAENGTKKATKKKARKPRNKRNRKGNS